MSHKYHLPSRRSANNQPECVQVSRAAGGSDELVQAVDDAAGLQAHYGVADGCGCDLGDGQLEMVERPAFAVVGAE